MSRLQRRKPDMRMPVNTGSYRDRACDLALSMLRKRGVQMLCTDAIKGVTLDASNWVQYAHSMYLDTLDWSAEAVQLEDIYHA